MNKIILFLLIIISSSLSQLSAQIWPKVYINPGIYSTGKVAFETYDNGIILLSENFSQIKESGWLIKTDVNGEVNIPGKLGQ